VTSGQEMERVYSYNRGARTGPKHRRELYHILWTCLPQAHLGSFNFVFDH